MSDHELRAFLEVARERSFTRAAAKLRVSQSALSYSMRQLETRLGIRLLTRTTRSVSLTAAGERLFHGIAPRYEDIDAELQAVTALRDKPAGSIRLTASDYAARYVLWPRLVPFLKEYPDISVEITTENGLADIVAQRYDAGVRFGDQVSQDMVSVRIGPDVRFAVVGSPEHFQRHGVPQEPADLLRHPCVNFRLPTLGGIYSWEFERDGRELKVRTEGQLVFSSVFDILEATLAGCGLAHMPEEIVAPHVAAGRLRRVLEDWCPYWAGHHLYYPSRRQALPAFSLLVEALRYRGRPK
ncbi:LysR family transcriptional regulator [Roseococcus sp. YIM B11640]|uniref:LysR family transcriptional regulator n=1 Tax=Roseococcus sp. YIM B11640 TaxID=3133973 RepID=UPI003C7B0600